MKVTVCLAVLCLALAYAEECRQTSDCSHVTCPENDYTLECHDRQCTCTHATATCAVVADCTGSCSRGWHCIDAKCRCFSWGGIGK